MKIGDTVSDGETSLASEAAPIAEPTPRGRKSGNARRWLGATALVAALVGGYAVWAQEQPKQGGATPAAPAQQAVPVVTAPVAVRDMPIYLTGIGTAQPSQSVTLKVRVDGQITKIGFTEGAIVNKGDLIAQIDPRAFQAQLEQAQAQKTKDEALLNNAKADLERFSGLLKNDYATRQSVDTQRALVAQYTAATQSDQAMIDYQTTQLSFTTITSPVTGVAGIRLIDEGNIVTGDRCERHRRCQSDRANLEHLHGPAGRARRRSRCDEQGRCQGARRRAHRYRRRGPKESSSFSTTRSIRRQAICGSRRISRTSSRLLWPGQFLNFKILIETRKDALTIPATAVQRGPQGTFVYIVTAEGTADVKPVTLVQSVDGVAIVAKGIEAGMTVVSDGQYKLRPGIKVTAQNAKTALNGAASNETPAAEIKR